MAKHGSGWMPSSQTPETSKPLVEKLHISLQEEGRDITDFGIDPFLSLDRMAVSESGAYIDTWRELGASHISVGTMYQGYTKTEQHLKDLRQFIENVK
jgi:hypothetical protein